jgi:nucleotide-binding universal stress UspA family protein
MYSKVLFPTDGSEDATEALAHALDIAQQYDAVLHTLYVDPPDDEPALLDETGEALSGDQIIADVEARASDAGLAVTSEVRQGDPSTVILDYAEETDIDLVVMATRGRTGLDRYILGSVTEDVVRSSDVPVLTVRVAEA